MNRLGRICTLALFVPGFLVFQIAAGPLAMCGAGSKTIVPCRVVTSSGPYVYLAVLCDPQPSDCCKTTSPPNPAGACCSRSLSSAAGQQPAPGKCSSCAEKKSKNTGNCRTRASCCTCLPVRKINNAALQLQAREILAEKFPADGASRALLDGQQYCASCHGHAPPLPLVVRDGPQQRIVNCSFLL